MANPEKRETICESSEGPGSEEERRSLLSELFVLWISPLIKLANERTLTAADVENVPESCSVMKNSQRIWQAWQKEKESSLNPSYFNALLTAYRQDLMVSAGFQILFMLSQLAQPILVGELVAFVNSADSAKDLTFGICIAFGLGFVSLFSSMCISRALGANRILGANMRAGIMFNVYRFSLDLSFSARAQNSVGQTTNLVSIDSEKFFLFIQFIHYLWQGPVTSFLVMLLLIQYVGYGPSLAGLAFVILLIPLQNYIARAIGIARRDMVKYTDNRVSLINEVVQTIRVIKFYAWEASFEEQINKARSRELSSLHTYLERNSLLREILFYAGPLTVFVVVATYVYGTGSKLEVAQTFRILAFINILRFPTNLLGQALKAYSDAVIAGSRLTNYFLLPERESVHPSKSSDAFVWIENASFDWTRSIEASDPSQSCTLSSINFTFKTKNELICIIGSVGSGKSSIMSTFLHEIPLLTGRCEVSGRIAFCSQRPWIQNMTLRDNVLFGADFTDPVVQNQYQQAITAAELLRDIEFLPNGDSTEIGERGINLSGGQKARVSLARAFFASFKSNLILLDDPFSAVDGNTGNKIFENGVLNHLADKTRIVALNSHMHLLPRFDRVIVLSEGRILVEGSPAELYRNHKDIMTTATGISDPSVHTADAEKEPKEESLLMRTGDNTKQAEPTKALIAIEKMQTGSVTAETYIRYFGAAFMPPVIGTPFYAIENSRKAIYRGFVVGTACSLVIFLVFSSSQLARLACDFYLAKWSRATDEYNESMFRGSYYIAICVLFVLLWARSSSLNIPAVLSTKNLHESALRSVISAPITEFFDTHTIGEILNKFSKDSETVDVNIPEFMLQMLIGWLQVLSVFALCIWTIPWFVLVALPLAIGYYQIYHYFSTISRNLKRLESVSRSPVYSSLSETLTGIETIRAYGDIERFRSSHLKKMELNHKLFYTFWNSLTWMTVRLELSTSLLLFSIALLVVFFSGSVSPISLGLALSFGLQLTALFQRCIQIIIDMSNYMTSTERLMEYLEIPQEQSIISLGADDCSKLDDIKKWDPNKWPCTGRIDFSNVTMQYRDNPPVLRNLEFSIRSGERVGICGRTGAGKSSMVLCLFRVVNLSEGIISIDGVDISQVPLQLLRRKISIIPQDPILFMGTIRFQLDPFDEYSDDEVWTVIKEVNLHEFISSLPLGLLDLVQEGGENLSQGQKQLLCIARALLRNTKVLVIDEGTSACDPHTDAIIQRALRQASVDKEVTVFTIAHRLQTILDYNRIIVLDQGRLAEFDSPKNLLANERSTIFKAMLSAADKTQEG